jgi:type I restriction enzyme S subunit
VSFEPKVLLGEIAELNPSLTEKPPDSTIVSFVPMAAVSGLAADTNGGEERIYRDVAKSYTPFVAGDLLVAKITPCFENGKIAQANIRHKIGFGSSEFHVVRPRNGCVDARYLLHFLRQEWIRIEGERKMTGSAGQRRVPEHFLAQLKVPLPPLREQCRIAAILDKVDDLRAKRRVVLEQLNVLTQSIFLEMFGDPATNPRHLPMVSLKDLFIFRTGKLDSNAAVANGSYPFFTCSREDLKIDHYAFDCEALLLAGNNANAAYSVKHYSGKFNAYQRTYVITLRDPSYSYKFARFALEYQLAEMKRRSKGTGTKYLTLEILNRMLIPFPPVEAQREFGRRLAAAGSLQAIHHSSMELLDGLFFGLQSDVFSGAF